MNTKGMADVEAVLRERARQEGGLGFHGWPDRWWDGYHVRCINGHVTKPVGRGRSPWALDRATCPRCSSRVHLTFPEDKDGRL